MNGIAKLIGWCCIMIFVLQLIGMVDVRISIDYAKLAERIEVISDHAPR
jgi:hypothetical protein